MNEHFCRAIEELDPELVRKIWRRAMPHLPQPENDSETLISMHMARTAISGIPFHKRAYSHAWLSERALPSQLPDHLRPRAEKLYPHAVAAVGIAVRHATPVALAIRRAMEGAVLDAGILNSELTKRAILAARAKARKQLLGIE